MSSKGNTTVWLRAPNSGALVKKFSLDGASKKSIMLGRASSGTSASLEDDGTFACPVMSKNHASLTWKDGSVILVDSGSMHGTFIGDSASFNRLEAGFPFVLSSDELAPTTITFGKLVNKHNIVHQPLTVEIFIGQNRTPILTQADTLPSSEPAVIALPARSSSGTFEVPEEEEEEDDDEFDEEPVGARDESAFVEDNEEGIELKHVEYDSAEESFSENDLEEYVEGEEEDQVEEHDEEEEGEDDDYSEIDEDAKHPGADEELEVEVDWSHTQQYDHADITFDNSSPSRSLSVEESTYSAALMAIEKRPLIASVTSSVASEDGMHVEDEQNSISLVKVSSFPVLPTIADVESAEAASEKTTLTSFPSSSSSIPLSQSSPISFSYIDIDAEADVEDEDLPEDAVGEVANGTVCEEQAVTEKETLALHEVKASVNSISARIELVTEMFEAERGRTAVLQDSTLEVNRNLDENIFRVATAEGHVSALEETVIELRAKVIQLQDEVLTLKMNASVKRKREEDETIEPAPQQRQPNPSAQVVIASRPTKRIRNFLAGTALGVVSTFAGLLYTGWDEL